MTIKQRLIFYGLATLIPLIDGVLIPVPYWHIAYVVRIALIIGPTLIAGITLGEFKEKCKRDKEMAGIVAERLLGKKPVNLITVDSGAAGVGWHNANLTVTQHGKGTAGMLAGMLGGIGIASGQGQSLSDVTSGRPPK